MIFLYNGIEYYRYLFGNVGEYIYVICTNLLKIYKFEGQNDFSLLTIIKSPHENAIFKCVICPIISEKVNE